MLKKGIISTVNQRRNVFKRPLRPQNKTQQKHSFHTDNNSFNSLSHAGFRAGEIQSLGSNNRELKGPHSPKMHCASRPGKIEFRETRNFHKTSTKLSSSFFITIGSCTYILIRLCKYVLSLSFYGFTCVILYIFGVYILGFYLCYFVYIRCIQN